LAGKIANPYQLQPVLARELEETVTKYCPTIEERGRRRQDRQRHGA
jgi:tRNA U34 5-carboxymethylaminomethyl modifying enzyme MnmG/GidA